MTLWDLLGVPSSCTDEDLKAAYRKKCKELHPDLNGGDAQKTALFVEMKKVYERALADRAKPKPGPIHFKMTVTNPFGDGTVSTTFTWGT